MFTSGCRHMCSLLVLTLAVTGAPSLAQGRHQRHPGDEPGTGTAEERNQEPGRPAVLPASIDQIIHECNEQAAALRKLPPDTVVQAVQLSDSQRDALEQVRISADGAAKTLDANCPKRIPAELGGKLDTLDNALILILESLNGLRPAVLIFYASLDDEQKGRLVAADLSRSSASYYDRAGTRKDPASAGGADSKTKSSCAQWAANLKGAWHIEDAGMQLSDPQRAASYELAAAIYRSTADLVMACPAENPVTPLGRLDAKQHELQALRQIVEAIRPSAAAFENSLNEVQRKRLAEPTDSRTR